jgi:tetrahydromethanopterin S-methyltransferase subunit G
MKSTAAIEVKVEPVEGTFKPIEEAVETVKTLKQQLVEAKNNAELMVEKFGAFSPEAVAAQKEIGKLNDKIQQFNNQVKGVTANNFQKIGTIATGIARGFETAQGALALFGGESEDLTKQLAKVQGAMAFADGIDSLKQMSGEFKSLGKDAIQGVIKAFGTLKGAIISTGIGALVVGLGLLITYWDDIKEALTGVSKEQGKVNNAMRDAVAAEQGNISKLQSYQKLTKDTSLSLAERKNALGELNKLGIETRDIDVTSAASMNILNARITDNIKLIKQRAQATALEKIIAEESETIFREKNKSTEEQLSLFDKYKASLFTFTAAQYNANKADIAKENQNNTITKSQKTLNAATDEYNGVLKDLTKTNTKVEETTTTVTDAYEKQSAILQNKLIAQTTALDKAKALELSNLNLTEKEKLEIENKYANLSIAAKQNAITKEQKITGLITDPKQKLAQETKLKQDLATLDVNVITQKTSYSQSLKDLADKEYETNKRNKEAYITGQNEVVDLTAQSQIDIIKLRDRFLKDKSKTELEIANVELNALQDKIKNYKEGSKEYIAISQQISDKETELHNKKIAEKDAEAAKEKEIQAAKFKAINDSLGAIGEIYTAFASSSEEDQKKAFEVNKAVSIAQAIVNTWQGVTAALANEKQLFPGQNLINAGLALAAGLVAVKKISDTTYQSKTTDKSLPSQASGQGTMQSFAPRQSTLGLNDALTQNRKVFVTEGDITRTQRRVSNNQAISVVE